MCPAANQTGKDFGMTFDKHIALPVRGKERGPYPDFKAMAVGDSAFFPNEGSITRCRAYLYVKSIEKRSKRYRYAGRSVIENGVAGVRIWRTA